MNLLITQNQATAKNGLTLSKSGGAYGKEQTISGGSHTHNYYRSNYTNEMAAGPHSVSRSESLTTISSSGSHSHTFTPSVSDNISYSLNGDSETRATNYTYKIWKRTA